MDFSTSISEVMRAIVSACQVPVIVLLILGSAFIVVLLGSLIGEKISERRHFKVFLPRLLDDLKQAKNKDEISDVIKKSGLLLRQKKALLELTRHGSSTPVMLESLAASIDYAEQKRYDSIVKVSDLTARIAPMLGLLGTLIPLGPGILALGSGDTQTLSTAIITAFDTTSLGLIIAGFALVISSVRKRWYKDYMVAFDTAIEFVLEAMKNESDKND